MSNPPEQTGKPESVLQTVDAQALALAGKLVREARFAALATLEPDSAHPLVTRVALAGTPEGPPLLLLSGLAAHTQALLADSRCSLLCGEPGGGEPLTYPRITLIGHAQRIERKSPQHPALRQRYLERHPKAALYVDFGDFGFWLVDCERASLNAGFGRAYALSRAQIAAALVAGN